MKSIIITGASGFIGQFLVKKFIEKNYHVIGIDIKDDKINDTNYLHINHDLSVSKNNQNITKILSNYNIHSCFHLAAKIKVDKSMSNPQKYYNHNVVALINILNILKEIKVFNVMFASTAAVYNINNIIDKSGIFKEEDAYNFQGLSVYGETKLYGEQILQRYSKYGFKGYIFRFFNVGGKYPDKNICHLIDIIIKNITDNKESKIFGNDYNTPDGTCIRDYIHVKDIANAFVMCNEKGYSHNSFKIYNLGSQKGYSVLEIINSCIKYYNEYHNKNIEYKYNMCGRREGDMQITVADSSKIKRDVGWKTELELKDIIIDTISTYH